MEANVRKLFEFARKLGLCGLIGEPAPDQLDLVEKMVKEYDIQLCFHNHPKNLEEPDYLNWEPAYLVSLMKNRDPRMEFSVDTGHLARSGVDCVEAIKMFRDRVHSGQRREGSHTGKRRSSLRRGNRQHRWDSKRTEAEWIPGATSRWNTNTLPTN